MDNQIIRIHKKLEILKRKDINFSIFGSERHKYKLNEVKSENQLLSFEETYQIKLPIGYRDFLKNIGNGGSGPYYGLESLENSTADDLDSPQDKTKINPSRPFKFKKTWNIDFNKIIDLPEEEYFKRKEITDYFSSEQMDGVLRISNFGCGVFLNLVVSGSEYGNIWVDDRCNDQGIYPDPYFKTNSRINFLDWYEYWLNKSLKEVNIDRVVNFSISESIQNGIFKFIRGLLKK